LKPKTRAVAAPVKSQPWAEALNRIRATLETYEAAAKAVKVATKVAAVPAQGQASSKKAQQQQQQHQQQQRRRRQAQKELAERSQKKKKPATKQATKAKQTKAKAKAPESMVEKLFATAAAASSSGTTAAAPAVPANALPAVVATMFEGAKREEDEQEELESAMESHGPHGEPKEVGLTPEEEEALLAAMEAPPTPAKAKATAAAAAAEEKKKVATSLMPTQVRESFLIFFSLSERGLIVLTLHSYCNLYVCFDIFLKFHTDSAPEGEQCGSACRACCCACGEARRRCRCNPPRHCGRRRACGEARRCHCCCRVRADASAGFALRSGRRGAERCRSEIAIRRAQRRAARADWAQVIVDSDWSLTRYS